MEETVILREYQKGDHPALSKIVRETWNYDRFASPKTAERMAAAYLDSCLTNQTFTQVAVVGGVPAGIIMAKDRQNHRCPLRFRLSLLKSAAALFFSGEGRRVSKIFSDVEKIDRELLKDSPVKYQGEIAFFAVDPRYRGRGLGKRLFQAAQDYLRRRQIRSVFLFTDTSCNYPFYEHQGMVRRGERSHTFQAGGQSGALRLFLYDNLGQLPPVTPNGSAE